ncbi:hypothetical protein [Niabella ginsengisoli]|uniref:Uncharacterized protein n=1 Tax=Niabella ginsengisoli TaxID=522298 RepID=A0ABS9SGN5_9BACT|nr:hypothetical protein [Niabella ginsengisoli]MCH5597319.1 hypothetical protein [Niabella ginsengisoli]
MRHVVLIALTCCMWSCRSNHKKEYNNDIAKRREVEVRVDSLINLIPAQRIEEIEILYDPGFDRKKYIEVLS